MVLVTGATGGKKILNLLAARGVDARAMVRGGDKTRGFADPPRVDTVGGDSTTRLRLSAPCRGPSA